MKRFRNTLFYIAIVAVFSALMYYIIFLGEHLEKGRKIIIPRSVQSHGVEFIKSMAGNLEHPLALLLAQIITIILAARIFGWICKKIGQPTVIGEIAAGIILGPSLFGMYFAGFSDALFPAKSLGNLQFLSQIGLILFMYVIGMELDLKVLKNKARDAVVVSHASIIFPFALGMALAFFIYRSFAPEGVRFLSFALFLGIAMSITAFPVLARIVQERGIHKTHLGTMVITCAAADDITAWCLLAATIAIVKAGSLVSSFYAISLAILYVFLMIKGVRPFLKRVAELHSSKENLSKPIVAIFFLILIISSYITEIIGIHALFGAFMAGAIIPDNVKFRNIFIEKVEDVAVVLLLPLFFVFTGLRTQIGLLNDLYLWKVTGLIILVAVTGKFIGSALAARFVGQSWKDSLTIGALMNTRGLMELVVLNIGYDLGVMTPEIFAMMVIMALVTTFMTGPLLDLINWIFKSHNERLSIEDNNLDKYKILLSFENPERGKSLLRLANGFVRNLNGNAIITAMHLSQSSELHHYTIDEFEKESFTPIITESQRLNIEITTLFKISNNISADITEVANKGSYDFLLVDFGRSIFEGNILGKILGFTTRIISPDRLFNQVTGKESLFENSPFDEKTRAILAKCNIPVGIFIDNGLITTNKVFIPVLSDKDAFIIKYAQKLIRNSDAQITLVYHTEKNDNTHHINTIDSMMRTNNNHFKSVGETSIDTVFLKQQGLMLASIESWKKLMDAKSSWLTDIPSTLIISENPEK